MDQCEPGNHFCAALEGSNGSTGFFKAGKIGGCGNHLGAVVGGGLAGLLAVAGDDVVAASRVCGPACVATAIDWGTAILRNHLTTDWGEHGACTTDVGPEHVTANTGTMPAIAALVQARGEDFTVHNPRASWILPWWNAIMVRNPQGFGADYVHRGYYGVCRKCCPHV